MGGRTKACATGSTNASSGSAYALSTLSALSLPEFQMHEKRRSGSRSQARHRPPLTEPLRGPPPESASAWGTLSAADQDKQSARGSKRSSFGARDLYLLQRIRGWELGGVSPLQVYGDDRSRGVLLDCSRNSGASEDSVRRLCGLAETEPSKRSNVLLVNSDPISRFCQFIAQTLLADFGLLISHLATEHHRSYRTQLFPA